MVLHTQNLEKRNVYLIITYLYLACKTKNFHIVDMFQQMNECILLHWNTQWINVVRCACDFLSLADVIVIVLLEFPFMFLSASNAPPTLRERKSQKIQVWSESEEKKKNSEPLCYSSLSLITHIFAIPFGIAKKTEIIGVLLVCIKHIDYDDVDDGTQKKLTFLAQIKN